MSEPRDPASEQARQDYASTPRGMLHLYCKTHHGPAAPCPGPSQDELEDAHGEALHEDWQRRLVQSAVDINEQIPDDADPIWRQHLGQIVHTALTHNDYFPGRPADAPEPTEYHDNPPGIVGQSLGEARRNVTDYSSGAGQSHAEQGRSLTHLGSEGCDQAVQALTVVDEKLGQIVQFFLAAGAGSSQNAAREAVEAAARAREQVTDTIRTVQEAKERAEAVIW